MDHVSFSQVGEGERQEGFYGFASKMHIKKCFSAVAEVHAFLPLFFPAFFQPSRLVAYYYSTFLCTFRCTYMRRDSLSNSAPFLQLHAIFHSDRLLIFLPSSFGCIPLLLDVFLPSSFFPFFPLFFIPILIRLLLLLFAFVTWFLFIYLFMFYLHNFPVQCRANPYRSRISEKRWFDIQRGEGSGESKSLLDFFSFIPVKFSYWVIFSLFARKNAQHNMKSHLYCAAA